ncbi:MAG: starvation-sensing protein RspA [Acidobacteria bacterium]|nr:MAG: starvation-sensing protein RspA [Acidobacteriota bacterium]
MQRRDVLRWLSSGVGAGGVAFAPSRGLAFQPPSAAAPAARGLPPLRITDVKTVLTAPNGIRLVVVKVTTSEPGLYGVGCATFTQRAYAVDTAVEKYLRPFLLGRNPDEIEDIWQSSYVSSYWRNGPVLFNAMSGVDEALWDIKAKRASMPLYQLLGGKVRKGADLYYHASGRDFAEVEDQVRWAVERGFRHVRIQVAVEGVSTYGAGGAAGAAAAGEDGPTNPTRVWEPSAYVRLVPRLFEHIRAKVGEEVELLHDVHERVTLPQAVQLCKELEKYRPFFIEDPLPPEENEHFRILRQQTSAPLAMGELFNTQHEYVPLVAGRLVDFIRCHVSQIGGLSMARKVAALCEFFGVRTAWHGPGDTSPVGHASQLALELASYNFGIHEGAGFPPETRDVFRGCPEVKDGYMLASEAPGHGIEVDEKLAAKFPYPEGPTFDYNWGRTRRRDGTVIRP